MMNPVTRVPDATIFIAGGDHGIGLLVAHHLVRAGAQRIGIVGSDPERSQSAAQSVFELASGIWALSAAGDVTDPTEADRVTSELAASIGDADILVNCLSDNAPGQVNMSRAVLPNMLAQGSGTIVTVVSESFDAATLPNDSGLPSGVRVSTIVNSGGTTAEAVLRLCAS